MARILLALFIAVPLRADIYDRLDELTHHLRSGGVPRDGIPAMTNPQSVAPEDAHYLADSDLVLGVVANGAARAYPHRLGWTHEVINDQLGGQYISVTFCPLTSTGLVFDAMAADSTQIELGVSGVVLNSNLVLYDRRDEKTLYPQMIYTGISGTRKGQRLQLLPVVETTWGLWRALHPHTTVVQAATGLDRYPDYIRALYPLDVYGHYPYGNYRSDHRMIIFPLTTARPSDRLSAKEMVLGLRAAGESRAYPFSRMPDKAVINDRVGDRAVLVLYDAETATAIPYSRVVRGQLLTFRILSRTGDLRLSSELRRAQTSASSVESSSRRSLPLAFADVETGSEWNMRGEALAGPLKGAQLEQIPAYNSMWFGWSAYWPQTRLWNGEGILPPP